MAGADRFYRPGQSGYVSQYMPIKLPFELMQQKLARTEQGVEAAKAASVFDVKAEGITKLDLPESVRSYYEGSGFDIEEKFNDIFIDDLRESTIAANEFNKKLNKATGDKNFILNVTSGDYANTLIDLQKEYKGLQAINSRNLARKEWTEKANQELAKHAKDISMSPYLLTDYSLELANMAKDKNYVPTSMPMIGESMDRVNEFLSQVDRLKDEGRKSDTIKTGELYNTWSSWKGRGADDYEAFGRSILDNKSSKIRQDIERQVDAHIRRGLLDEGNKEAAIEFEVNKLIKSARELEHFDRESGNTQKSQHIIDAEKGPEIYPIDEAVSDIQYGTTTTVKDLEGLQNMSQQNIDQLKKYTSGVLTAAENYGFKTNKGEALNFENLATLSREELIKLAETTGYTLPVLTEARQRASKAIKHNNNITAQAEQANIFAKSAAGFDTQDEMALTAIGLAKANPEAVITMIDQIEKGGNAGNIARLTPEQKKLFVYYNKAENRAEFDDLKKIITNPDFALSTIDSKDFYDQGQVTWVSEEGKLNYNQEFNGAKALKWLKDNNVDFEQWVGLQSPTNEAYTRESFSERGITEEAFNQVMNHVANKSIKDRYGDYKSKQRRYLGYKQAPFETAPTVIRTKGGFGEQMDETTILNIANLMNPLESELTINGEKQAYDPGNIEFIQAYLRNNAKDGMWGVQVGKEDYKIDQQVPISVAFAGDTQEILDRFATSRGEKAGTYSIDDISGDKKELLKLVNDWADNTMVRIGLDVKVDKSERFTADRLERIKKANDTKRREGTITSADLAIEAQIMNGETIDEVNNMMVSFISNKSIGKKVSFSRMAAGMAGSNQWYEGKESEVRKGEGEKAYVDISKAPGSINKPITIPIHTEGLPPQMNFNLIGVETEVTDGTRGEVNVLSQSDFGESIYEVKESSFSGETVPIEYGGKQFKRFTLDKDGTLYTVNAYDMDDAIQTLTNHFNK